MDIVLKGKSKPYEDNTRLSCNGILESVENIPSFSEILLSNSYGSVKSLLILFSDPFSAAGGQRMW